MDEESGVYIKVVGGTPIVFNEAKNEHKFLLKDGQIFSTLDRLFDAMEDQYRFNHWIPNEKKV